jgi:hypothetical protein
MVVDSDLDMLLNDDSTVMDHSEVHPKRGQQAESKQFNSKGEKVLGNKQKMAFLESSIKKEREHEGEYNPDNEFSLNLNEEMGLSPPKPSKLRKEKLPPPQESTYKKDEASKRDYQTFGTNPDLRPANKETFRKIVPGPEGKRQRNVMDMMEQFNNKENKTANNFMEVDQFERYSKFLEPLSEVNSNLRNEVTKGKKLGEKSPVLDHSKKTSLLGYRQEDGAVSNKIGQKSEVETRGRTRGRTDISRGSLSKAEDRVEKNWGETSLEDSPEQQKRSGKRADRMVPKEQGETEKPLRSPVYDKSKKARKEEEEIRSEVKPRSAKGEGENRKENVLHSKVYIESLNELHQYSRS